MVSETAALLSSDDNGVKRSVSSKKNPNKVPRKIVKAEREKLKRDNMNELFLRLGNVIELANENNGKASMLNDTIKLLRELFTQIECLKKENTSLLSESHYVTVEKNELKEENSTLEAQIEKLQSEIEKRVQPQSSWNSSLYLSHPITQKLPEEQLGLPSVDHASNSASIPTPLFVLPIHHDLQAHSGPDITEPVTKVPSHVSRPRPRYPSQSDSWPSDILGRQLNRTETTK